MECIDQDNLVREQCMNLTVLIKAMDIKIDDLKDRQLGVLRVLNLGTTRPVLKEYKTLQK